MKFEQMRPFLGIISFIEERNWTWKLWFPNIYSLSLSIFLLFRDVEIWWHWDFGDVSKRMLATKNQKGPVSCLHFFDLQLLQLPLHYIPDVSTTCPSLKSNLCKAQLEG